METVKNSVVPRRWGEGRMNKSSTEDSEDSKTTLYNNIKVDTCDYIFAQTTESQTPKGNLCKL